MRRKEHPALRALRALFHSRFQRRCNFIINTMILEEREEMVRQERQLRQEQPELFSRSGFYNSPFGVR